jgi:hypothetical protein
MKTIIRNCFLCGSLSEMPVQSRLCDRCFADPRPTESMTPSQRLGWVRRLKAYWKS